MRQGCEKGRIVTWKSVCWMLLVVMTIVMVPSVCAQAKWVKQSGKYRYTTNASGKKYYKNRWAKIKGKYYYFDASGYRKTGWLKYNGKKYYLNKKGVRVTGMKTIQKRKYYFNRKGVMITGWIKYQDEYYYMNENGVAQTGLKKIGKNIYYFDRNGIRVTNTTIKLGNLAYYFGSNGNIVYTGKDAEILVKRINVERILNGYKPLQYYESGNLASAVAKRAVELASRKSHLRPNGMLYATVLTNDYSVPHYWSGECSLWGNPKKGEQVANSWLEDSNRSVLLVPEADAIAAGRYVDENGCEYWNVIVIQKK